MKAKTVHILGCGPAGLLAAHEATVAGHQVKVHSIKIPSDIKGAQYVDQPVVGITTSKPDALLKFIHVGEPEVYADKVYGRPDADTSWAKYKGLKKVPAWSMINVYQKLWDLYEDCIVDTEVRGLYIEELLPNAAAILSTITPQGYCQMQEPDGHTFEWQEVWITESCSAPDEMNNMIMYNGLPDEPWYRSSRIMNVESTEYGHKTAGVWRATRKPLVTDCDCYTENECFHRLGRYGVFSKGLLVSDAMLSAREICDALR